MTIETISIENLALFCELIEIGSQPSNNLGPEAAV